MIEGDNAMRLVLLRDMDNTHALEFIEQARRSRFRALKELQKVRELKDKAQCIDLCNKLDNLIARFESKLAKIDKDLSMLDDISNKMRVRLFEFGELPADMVQRIAFKQHPYMEDDDE